METSETRSTKEESYVLLTSPAEGIPLVFYTVLVKMEPLVRKCNGDVLKFFRETGRDWDTNGTLCSAKAMSLQDLEDCFESLRSRGMQCEAAPVDFCLVSAALGYPEHLMQSCCETLDDGEIEFYDNEDHGPYARLKTVPAQGDKSI